MKPGSYNSSRCTYFKLNCAYLVCASLNSLYISNSVLPVVEICATLKYAVLSYKRRTYNRENEISAAALNIIDHLQKLNCNSAFLIIYVNSGMQEIKPTITTTGNNRSLGGTALYGLYRDVPSGQGMVYILSVLSRKSNFMRVCPNRNQVIVHMIGLNCLVKLICAPNLQKQ